MNFLRKSSVLLTRLPFISSLIALVVIGVVAVAFERQVTASHAQKLRIEVLNQANQLRSRLETQISRNILAAQGLVAVIGFRPDITQEEFSLLGDSIVINNRQIRNLAGAPDLVNTMVHPLEGNEAALGLNYREKEDQNGSVFLAMRTGSIVLAGPVNLVQGGQGFIGRLPVYTHREGGGREFWGIVSTVIDTQALYRDAGLTHPDLQIDVALKGVDGRPALGQLFFGDADLLNRDPVHVDVVLPYGTWKLYATPKGGWEAQPINWKVRGMFALTVLMVAGPILGATVLLDARQSYHNRIREAESERESLATRLELALKASGVGIWDADLKSGKTIWDEQARRIYGHMDGPGITTAADFANVVHPEDYPAVKAEVDRAIEEHRKLNLEYRLKLGNEIRHVRTTASMIWRDGDAVRMVGVIWDVTDDIRRQDELAERTTQAEAATVAKSQFLATMSHEIRTPMSGILGMLDLLSEEDLGELQHSRVTIAQESAQNLMAILNDILDFSKIEADGIELEPESTDVWQLAHNTTDLMTASAGQKGLGLSCTISDSVPQWLEIDPIRYRQIMSNLVNNAIKFTTTGRVEVFLECEDLGGDMRRLVCRVMDTGMGIPADEIETVFGKFYQTDSSASRKSGGTGLGLAISRQLTEMMGGKISVESRPGEGSTFTFHIRTRIAEAPSGAVPQGETVSEEGPENLRILVAEDNSTNQYLIRAYLGSEHDLTLVSNGRDAVSAIRDMEFDVVLMDIQMPEMDGIEATEIIRAMEGPGAAVPIIALTANAVQGDRETYLAAGMTEYVTKPIDRKELIATIARVAAPGRGGMADMDRTAVGF
ncbi:ATP-binding protein [Amaricoccus tamworthensis]|uniref:ATP-binding protein n=1 Tax=Amaricoccus tamworthensis TaxID=57002 RepID=UPI003C7C72E3